jgi:hypothetical protein
MQPWGKRSAFSLLERPSGDGDGSPELGGVLPVRFLGLQKRRRGKGVHGQGPASRALASHGIKTFNDFGERNIIASVQLEGEKKRVIPSTGAWEAI